MKRGLLLFFLCASPYLALSAYAGDGPTALCNATLDPALVVQNILDAHQPLPFDQIRIPDLPYVAQAAVDHLAALSTQIRSDKNAPQFGNTLLASAKFREAYKILEAFFSEVYGSVLRSVENPDVSVAEQIFLEKAQPLYDQFFNDSRLLNRNLEFIRQNQSRLEEDQLRLAQVVLPWFKNQNGSLNLEQQKQLNDYQTQLSAKSRQFADRIRSARAKVQIAVYDASQLEGLSEPLREAAKRQAEKLGQPQAWILTNEGNNYLEVVGQARNRWVREQMFRLGQRSTPNTGLYSAPSSMLNSLDADEGNLQLISQIANLRAKIAKLQGADNFLTLQALRLNAGNVRSIEKFIYEMADWALPKAQADLKQLQQVALEDGISELKSWDVLYYAGVLKAKIFQSDPADLLPYFEFEGVNERIFSVFGEIFGVRFVRDNSVSVYHSDVVPYRVSDERSGELLGYLYFDPFSRPSKTNAFMSEIRPRFASEGTGFASEGTGFASEGTGLASTSTSIANQAKMGAATAILSCQYRKPAPGSKLFLSFNEVVTQVHELGHLLHSFTAQSRYSALGGPNSVPPDTAEVPSKLFELWLNEFDFVTRIARHFQTGAPLAPERFTQILREKNFMAGLYYLGRAQYSLLDFAWHTRPPRRAEDIAAFEANTLKPYLLLPTVEGLNISQIFGHIFAPSGYEGFFFSYDSSATDAADLFESFRSEGVLNPQVGRRFRQEYLGQANLRSINQSHRLFRGTDPSAKAFFDNQKD